MKVSERKRERIIKKRERINKDESERERNNKDESERESEERREWERKRVKGRRILVNLTHRER